MTVCTIVLAVVNCVNVQPATPQQAVDTLQGGSVPFHYVAPVPRGPFVASTGSTEPSLGPWQWPVERPATRLDGTLLSDWPVVYGVPWWLGWQGGSHHDHPSQVGTGQPAPALPLPRPPNPAKPAQIQGLRLP